MECLYSVRQGARYIAARREVVKSIFTSLDSEDMQYFSNTERERLWEQYGTEVPALDKALGERGIPSNNILKRYAVPVFDEQVEKLKAELPFEEHGWSEADIHNAVFGNVEVEELKDYLQKHSVDVQYEIPQYEDNPLGLPPLDDELTVLAVQPDIELNENQTIKGAALLKNEVVDGWYVIGFTHDGDGNALSVGNKTNIEKLGIAPFETDPNIIRTFDSEQEARSFYDERVKVLNSLKENYDRKVPDYEAEVIK